MPCGSRPTPPFSGQLVKKHTTEDVVECMKSYSKGTRYTVLAPLCLRDGRTLEEQLDIDLKQGFARIEVNGEIVRIEDYQPRKATPSTCSSTA